MSEPAREIQPADARPLPLFLKMIIGAVGMVLLLVFLAVIGFWKAFASATQSLRDWMTLASRNASCKIRSWRRPLHLFYLGLSAKRDSSRPPWSPPPKRASLEAEVPAPTSSGSRTKILEAGGIRH